jgi:hypothetical protein
LVHVPRDVKESCHEDSATKRVGADTLTMQGLFEAFHINFI